MTDASALVYAHEFITVSDDQISHWEVHDRYRKLPILTGLCPTCGHDCEVEVRDTVVVGGLGASAKDQATPREWTAQIICNCRRDHKQPEGVRGGCGRYWLGRLTKQEGGTYALSTEKNLRLLPAAAALNEALAAQDKRVQYSAEKWLGAVSAIYALFSLTGIATAKDALTGMNAASKWGVALALVAGVTLAVLAVISGYKAAYGWPRAVRVGTENLEDWYDQYQGYAVTAAAQLRVAVFLSLFSLAAIIGVMVLVWFLPRG
ncbi:hypothetical protein OG429_13065 [Streptomyces sp. NBC_00190]|uniref:hypothetical protein n=1 Tax=unclassified Streptomyces TaxID=2593676 RepID=UPI002E2C563B|nr:hypothetical protein [Streptomyces sp. NBC_00190]WSZ40198.1 hypothetical protein OG239_16070 [Streptomyces sp. NBC_00868]